jgi:enamine deaminase RidA (YjgF/YER057c/UK114 family)
VSDNQLEMRHGTAVVPPVWRAFYDQTSVPAAALAGDTLRLSGHTGEDADGVYPDGVDDQIRGTFRNLALTLDAAGATWSDVVEIHSYHVGLRDQAQAMLRIAAEFLTAPYPAWTAVGVTELFSSKALIEIRCTAILGEPLP